MTTMCDDDDGREEDNYPIDDTLSLLVFFSSKPALCFQYTLPDTTYHQLNGRLRVERGVWDDVETETNVDDYDADGERRRTVLIDDTLSLWCSQSHHHLPSCFMDACGSRGASGDDETSETKTKTKFWTIIVCVEVS